MLYEEFASEHTAEPEYSDRLGPDGDLRPGCPRCGGWNLRERKGTGRSAGRPRYFCASPRNHRQCQFEFDNPVLVQPLRVESGQFALRQAFARVYEPIYQATNDWLYRLAVKRAVEEFALYMSGDGTATFCKTCAFNWDKLGVRLCVECRDAWHPLDEQQCNACRTGGTWVLCKECQEARHLDRYSMCYACNQRGSENDVVG